jgi:hypothetical protein
MRRVLVEDDIRHDNVPIERLRNTQHEWEVYDPTWAVTSLCRDKGLIVPQGDTLFS